jgi:hypothetical protein
MGNTISGWGSLMSDRQIFDQLSATWRSEGPAATLEQLADYLLRTGRYHELFEARKLQVRQRLGLPAVAAAGDEALPEATREALEDGLIAACREVGLLLLRSGRLRDAWHYLRVVGDRPLVQRELECLQPTDQNVDEFLELCLHEGLNLPRGFQLLLDHYGICNAITTFESVMYGRPRQERAVGAGALVEHLHEQLRANVLSHIERQEGEAPRNASLVDLLTGRGWLFDNGAYHVDTTHLASVVRCARELDDPEVLRRALELTAYGAHLDPALQYPGDEPFEALYEASHRYLSALLGLEPDDQVAYFRERAEASKPREETTATIETYIDLLARLGRPREALQEALRLLPEDVQTTGRAPSLLELAAAAADFAPLEQIARRRGDALGFALCLLKAAEPPA